MKLFRLLPALAALCALPAAAATMDFDAGLRAAIWNDNYKLGVGGELGAIAGLGKVDLGLHLNYTHFTAKTNGYADQNETGGYVTLYLLPPLDQAFQLRLGPHIGASYIKNTYVDVGGDVAAVFQANPKFRFYFAFVPAYFISVGDAASESLFRVGLGIELRPGG